MTILLLAGASCSSDSKSSSTTPVAAATALATSASAAAAPATTAPAYAETAGTTAGTTAGSTAETVVSADAGGAGSVAGPDAGDPATGANVSLQGASPFGTALAITASVGVEVKDVRDAVNHLAPLVASNGGAIFDSQVSVGDPAHATATITVKIPPPGLENLVSGLGGLGELTSRDQQTEDVADQLTDTQNRIAAAQASVDRVRTLLADAKDIDAIIRIEGELTIRETALEQLLAVERNVTDRVQLATLTIVFIPKPVVVPVPVEVPKLIEVGAKVQPSSAVARALNSGWHGFGAAIRGIVIGAAYISPLMVLLLIAGLVALVVRRIRRSVRRRAAVSPMVSPTTSPTAVAPMASPE